jgi:hypothetical protein
VQIGDDDVRLKPHGSLQQCAVIVDGTHHIAVEGDVLSTWVRQRSPLRTGVLAVIVAVASYVAAGSITCRSLHLAVSNFRTDESLIHCALAPLY